MVSDDIQSWFDESPVISREEALRRIPTVHLIDDDDIRDDVVSLTQYAPPYFWERPGSYSGYHNAESHGLWFHTLKLSSVIESLKDTHLYRDDLTEENIDFLHASAILHDQWKNGTDPRSEDTADDHARVAAEVASEYSELPYTAVVTIHQHMGPFDDEPDCNSVGAELLHTADMIAADDNMHPGVYGPVPKEITQSYNPHVIDVVGPDEH